MIETADITPFAWAVEVIFFIGLVTGYAISFISLAFSFLLLALAHLETQRNHKRVP